MPYCPQCGSQTEPEAAFCGDCGARLEEQAAPAPSERRPPTPRPGARQGATLWSLLGGLVVLGGVALGLVALYDAAANDGDWADSLFGDGGGGKVVVAVQPLTPTPTLTDQPSPTAEPTATAAPLPEEPTATPISAGYLTPEEAIGAFLAERDLPYVGDCEGASIETDVGSYCSLLWEERFDSSIYVAGPTFSEPDTWLLMGHLSGGDDWTVLDLAEFVPGPQDTVPPW
jgi:hypothetical protein